MHSTHTFLDGRRPPVRGLIFDMDGTILDTRAYHMKAWRELVAAHGLEQRHYEVAEKGFGKTNGAIFHQWYREDAAEHDFDALGEEKEALFRQLIRGKVRPRPRIHRIGPVVPAPGDADRLGDLGPARQCRVPA